MALFKTEDAWMDEDYHRFLFLTGQTDTFNESEIFTHQHGEECRLFSLDEIREKKRQNEMNKAKENDEKRRISSNYKGMKILAENLKEVLLEGQITDLVLKVDSHEFKAHKAALVARSPVFAAMFQQDFLEKKSNAVNIPDCTADSFEVFLHYIYSGSAEALSTSNVNDVYRAAIKYRIYDLKEKCVDFMSSNNIRVKKV